MSDSQIEWTDVTWNPVAGCLILSSGCSHCYVMHMACRLEVMGVEKYVGLTRKSGTRMIWRGVIREDRASLDIPRRWQRPRKIFVNSMSDLFHDGVSDSFIADVWQAMRDTPHHTYQILTKRPDRMAGFLSTHTGEVLDNVWLGPSVENRDVVDRIDFLRQAPAAIRFISFEPLIGSVGAIELSDIHWAIVGGESGSAARPVREEWIDEIHDLCRISGTAFFFRQWGTCGCKIVTVRLYDLFAGCGGASCGFREFGMEIALMWGAIALFGAGLLMGMILGAFLFWAFIAYTDLVDGRRWRR